VYCAQTAGWIKMAFGTEVDIGPGHSVLAGDPPPLPKKKRDTSAANFRPMSVVAKRSPISATAERMFHLAVRNLVIYSDQ